MSENTLVKKIKADTEQAVAEVRAKQAESIRAIEAETAAKVKDMETESRKQLEKTLAHNELVALSRAKQAANITLQTAKRKELDEVFEVAKTELKELVGDEYVAFFTAQAKKILPESVPAITSVLAPDHKESETKDILKTLGVDMAVTADESVQAGLVIRTADGVYDLTLDRLFADKRADMEIEVMRVLNA